MTLFLPQKCLPPSQRDLKVMHFVCVSVCVRWEVDGAAARVRVASGTMTTTTVATAP